MIHKPTVLILGAGASFDFGFPLGSRLKRLICEMLSAPSAARSTIVSAGFDADTCEAFAAALQRSGAASIDAFLARRADMVAIGKAAIAAILVPFENPLAIHALVDEPTWLDRVFQRMAAPKNDWVKNNLSIVTFNYDRVVEHYLYVSLKNTFGLDDDEALRLSSSVPIVHVHGRLGEFNIFPHNDGRIFSPNLTVDALRKAAAGIRIIHEGAAGDGEFVTARDLIQRAEEVVIMGFGYDRTNMSRLGFPHTLEDSAVCGSAIGMRTLECAEAERNAVPPERLDRQSPDLREFLRVNDVLRPFGS